MTDRLQSAESQMILNSRPKAANSESKEKVERTYGLKLANRTSTETSSVAIKDTRLRRIGLLAYHPVIELFTTSGYMIRAHEVEITEKALSNL